MTNKIAAKVAVATRLEQSLHLRDSPPKWQSRSTLSFSTFQVPAAKVAVAKYTVIFTLGYFAAKVAVAKYFCHQAPAAKVAVTKYSVIFTFGYPPNAVRHITKFGVVMEINFEYSMKFDWLYYTKTLSSIYYSNTKQIIIVVMHSPIELVAKVYIRDKLSLQKSSGNTRPIPVSTNEERHQSTE
ncbi:7409_t:CDS:1 [Paraglomus brasilianum]|uniref:7409_t:CDS:1 n=1 Tax=Paraglomus brasilianum TaxID=144538 RepID=A0A9N9F3V1_9GLOM|nr:7409_t:CDS:1 [Paraglomus brasilianum]